MMHPRVLPSLLLLSALSALAAQSPPFKRYWSDQIAAMPASTLVLAAASAPGGGVLLITAPAVAPAVGNVGTALWDGSTVTGLAIPMPAVSDPVLAPDPIGGGVIMFGWDTMGPTSPVSTTWRFAGGVWTMLVQAGPPTAPARRVRTAMATEDAGTIVLFGGLLGTNIMFNDTWRWSGAAWALVPAAGVPALPAPRWSHCMASVAGRVILFGGIITLPLVPVVQIGDTFQLIGNTWTQLAPPTSPGPRDGCALVRDLRTDQLVLTGGFNPTGSIGETFMFDNATTTWSSPASIGYPGLGTTVGAFDAVHNEVVAGGGAGGAFAFAVSGERAFRSFGTGCNCAGSPGVGTLVGSGSGSIGTTQVWVATSMPANSLVTFAFAFAEIPATPIGNGFPASCLAFIGPVIGSVSVLSDASGIASISLAIPNSVVHVGSNLMHQALSLFGPLCATNATELRVGR